MFHTQINGAIVVFSENLTFKAHIDFHGSVPLIQNMHTFMVDKHVIEFQTMWTYSKAIEVTS